MLAKYLGFDAMISIHAPVKGATLIHIRRHYNRDISIHAPVKGATQRREKFRYPWRTFQSTHP